LRKRQPKLLEQPKRTLLIKGNKTSNSVQNFMRDIVIIILFRENLEEREQFSIHADIN
jgi:hypothetical protein